MKRHRRRFLRFFVGVWILRLRREQDEPVEVRLRRAINEGGLDEDMLTDALGMRDYDFVIGALAHLVKSDFISVKKIIDMHAPKPIVALSWKAGLSMRFALRLQKTVGEVQPKEMLYPKGGSDYPLTDDEVQWQLDFLNL